jgi:hypothetical protein
LAVFVLASACKRPAPSQEAAGVPTTPSVSASSSANAKAPLPTIVGTDVKAVACNLGMSVPEGDNEISATRNVHRGPDNSLYFFADYKPPTRLEPTEEGCGYRLSAAPMVLAKNHEFGVDPDGAISQYDISDSAPRTACRIKAFDNLRYGRGTRVGTTFFYRDDNALKAMDLASDKCAARDVVVPDVPRVRHVAAAGDELLIRVPHNEWKWGRGEVLRYDPLTSKVLSRQGVEEGKGAIDGDPYACGDGLCVASGAAHIEIHDHAGMLVRTYNLYDLAPLKNISIAGIVDVPKKGVYVLAGHRPVVNGKSDKGRAELLRLEGVY